MKMQDHVQILLDSARYALDDIESGYRNSLAKKELDIQLFVQIKNLLENLRSALDYVAREVFNKFCTGLVREKPLQVYFPVLRRTATAQDFSAFMNGRFPGLQVNAHELYNCLEECQFYKSSANEWLVQFNDLCQSNKHEQLSPQTRSENKRTEFADISGGSVSWNDGVQFGPSGITFKPGGKLSFASGGTVRFGQSGMRIMGRQVDTRAQAPAPDDTSSLRHVVWVDFRFDALGVSALPFLRTCVNEVTALIDAVRTTALSIENNLE